MAEKRWWGNDYRLSQRSLEKALLDFDPDWAMQAGHHLTDEDYDFLESCNVSWEYNNEEREERLKNDQHS